MNTSLSINSIILTTGVINAIHNCGKAIGKGYKISNTSKYFYDLPLNKNIQGKIDAMKNGIMFEPIIVYSLSDSDKYVILDGRHRFVASFIIGYEQIPVKIVRLYHSEKDEPPNKKLKK